MSQLLECLPTLAASGHPMRSLFPCSVVVVPHLAPAHRRATFPQHPVCRVFRAASALHNKLELEDAWPEKIAKSLALCKVMESST